MNNGSLQHAVMLLTNVIQILVNITRGSDLDRRKVLFDRAIANLNNLIDYLSDIRNS